MSPVVCRGVFGALWAATTCAAGCGLEEPACGLAEVREEGWVPVVEPSARPFAVGDLRPVLCVHGIVPCDPEIGAPRSGDEAVLRVLRDASVPWLYYLAAVGTGRITLRQQCAPDDEAVYVLEVR